MNDTKFLSTSRGYALAYRYTPGKEPCVVFIHGYGSTMQGDKAIYFEQFCRKQNNSFLRFDLSGCGESEGDFSDATIERWLKDCEDIIDKIATGSLILIGSSMGGWLMTLLALARQQRVAACFGIACAPDMTAYKLSQGFSEAQTLVLNAEGVIDLESHSAETSLPLYKKLLYSGTKYSILNSSITLPIPLHLVHARDDLDVPWQRSQALQTIWHCGKSDLTLLSSGGHRLSDELSLQLLGEILEKLLHDVRNSGKERTHD
jgi:pimeloyl-ACP methyl ester carboxylesterase